MLNASDSTLPGVDESLEFLLDGGGIGGLLSREWSKSCWFDWADCTDCDEACLGEDWPSLAEDLPLEEDVTEEEEEEGV